MLNNEMAVSRTITAQLREFSVYDVWVLMPVINANPHLENCQYQILFRIILDN